MSQSFKSQNQPRFLLGLNLKFPTRYSLWVCSGCSKYYPNLRTLITLIGIGTLAAIFSALIAYQGLVEYWKGGETF